MSLRVDDRSSRGRSKSGTRERDRSRSNVRSSKAPSPPASKSKSKSSKSNYSPPSSIVPSRHEDRIVSPTYETRSPENFAPPSSGYFPQAAPGALPYPPDEDGGFTMGDYSDFPPEQRPGYIPQPTENHWGGKSAYDRDSDDDLAYGASPQTSRHQSYSSKQPGHVPYPDRDASPVSSTRYQYAHPGDEHKQPYSSSGYQQPKQYEYAAPPDKITYTATPQGARADSYTAKTQATYPSYTANTHDQRQQLPRSYSDGKSHSSSKDARLVEVVPNGLDPRGSISSSHRLSVSNHDTGLNNRMNRLSVSGNRPDMHSLHGNGSGGMPPPSPLLEAYHGTYQSLSPMPGAFRTDDDDLSDLEPLSPGLKSAGGKHNDKLSQESAARAAKKRAVIYDAESDAKAIAKALDHHSKIDAEAFIDVLPPLTHDQILELRKEYKKQVKIQGRGIKLPAHLKLKLPSGNFGKAVYVCALGRWESEGYWANFFYQGHASRRELLIESLLARSNAEIREIKDSFRDKRYADSLTKCMEKELKADKFKTAVMMALEGRRQEEQDVYPREYVERDVEGLVRSVNAEKGGETAMLEVVLRRSDAHLREVMRGYQARTGENFARVALGRSGNLVGEVLAHILNGAINRPARDALLLHHAIRDISSHPSTKSASSSKTTADKDKPDEIRYELLISRVIRLHWDRAHMARVKRDYEGKYGRSVEAELEGCLRGDFGEFMGEVVSA
ncbi:hypothetical protein LTR95_002666 [Oleoguttula sp. CCFEE 5521]